MPTSSEPVEEILKYDNVTIVIYLASKKSSKALQDPC